MASAMLSADSGREFVSLSYIPLCVAPLRWNNACVASHWVTTRLSSLLQALFPSSKNLALLASSNGASLVTPTFRVPTPELSGLRASEPRAEGYTPMAIPWYVESLWLTHQYSIICHLANLSLQIRLLKHPYCINKSKFVTARLAPVFPFCWLPLSSSDS